MKKSKKLFTTILVLSLSLGSFSLVHADKTEIVLTVGKPIVTPYIHFQPILCTKKRSEMLRIFISYNRVGGGD